MKLFVESPASACLIRAAKSLVQAAFYRHRNATASHDCLFPRFHITEAIVLSPPKGVKRSQLLLLGKEKGQRLWERKTSGPRPKRRKVNSLLICREAREV